MKILFISSGTSKRGVSPLVKSQGRSIDEKGHSVDYFTVKEGGLTGYLGAARQLRKYLNEHESFDLLHAHYGLSALTALLGKQQGMPLVVSFMGDDVMGSKRLDGSVTLFSRFLVQLNRFMARFFYDAVIVKSDEMKERLGLERVHVIPNGVNLDAFYPEEKRTVRKRLGTQDDEKMVLFVSNPERPEKNYALAERSVNLLNEEGEKILLKALYGQKRDTVRDWMNATDVMVLTSYHEGSPNVIKEAMACNCPVVSTDVGDVKEVVGETEGCWMGGYDSKDFAAQLQRALEFAKNQGRTKGRKQILRSGLDKESIAKRIIGVYREVLG